MLNLEEGEVADGTHREAKSLKLEHGAMQKPNRFNKSINPSSNENETFRNRSTGKPKLNTQSLWSSSKVNQKLRSTQNNQNQKLQLRAEI